MANKYVVGKPVTMRFEQALERVAAELAEEGFGILTEINVAATIKQKLGKDMPPYNIFGACNPQLAHRALEAEPQIGALLPCNVVLREDASGQTIVGIMDPQAVLQLVDRAEVGELAAEVRKRLERVLDSV